MSNVINGTVPTNGTIKGSLYAVLGKDGLSAYELALANGFEGTETEWLASLKGEQGIQGIQGERGLQGEKGDTGNSGVYVGSGDMPADCNVQIDPNGDVATIADIAKLILSPTATIENGTLILLGMGMPPEVEITNGTLMLK